MGRVSPVCSWYLIADNANRIMVVYNVWYVFLIIICRVMAPVYNARVIAWYAIRQDAVNASRDSSTTQPPKHATNVRSTGAQSAPMVSV